MANKTVCDYCGKEVGNRYVSVEVTKIGNWPPLTYPDGTLFRFNPDRSHSDICESCWTKKQSGENQAEKDHFCT